MTSPSDSPQGDETAYSQINMLGATGFINGIHDHFHARDAAPTFVGGTHHHAAVLGSMWEHRDFLKKLRANRPDLHHEFIPYVPLDTHCTWHPHSILERVHLGNARILLAGMAGIGKSRLLIEVGTLASEAGYHVMHLEPLDWRDAVAQIRRLPDIESPRLLIIDDMGRIAGEGGVLDMVISAIDQLSVSSTHDIAFLGAVQLSWLASFGEETKSVGIDILEAPSDGRHTTTVCLQVARSVAPGVTKDLSDAQILRLTGNTRPAVALLQGRYMEAQRNAALDSGGARLHNLERWLSSALRADALIPAGPPRAAVWRPDDHAYLLPAFGALATLPLPKDDLIHVVFQLTKNRIAAHHTVDLLSRFGWIIEVDGTCQTLHSMVVDLLSPAAMLAPVSNRLHPDRVFQLMDSTLERHQALGNALRALDRLRLDGWKDEGQGRQLGVLLRQWFLSREDRIAKLWRGNSAPVFHAAAIVLETESLRGLAGARWRTVFEPLLTGSENSPDAYPLILAACRSVPRQHEGSLPQLTLAWFQAGNRANGYPVLRALLRRPSLDVGVLDSCVYVTVSWMEETGFPPEGEYVLSALVERSDLSEVARANVITAGWTWLRLNTTNRKGSFLLGSMLSSCPPLTMDWDVLMVWIESHLEAPELKYVLRPILLRADFAPPYADALLKTSVTWIETYLSDSESRFALTALLERVTLVSDCMDEAINLAGRYLELHGGEPESPLVVGSLQKASERAPATDIVARWVVDNLDSGEIDFAVVRLLRSSQLSEETARLLHAAMPLALERYAQSPDGRFLLRAALNGRRHLNDAEYAVVLGQSITWLDSYVEQEEAGFVLSALLTVPDLGQMGVASAVSAALEKWRRRFATSRQARYVVGSLLKRDDLGAQDLERAVEWALLWARHPTHRGGSIWVVQPLLRRHDLQEVTVRAIQDLAMEWLAAHPTSRKGPFLIRPLAERSDASTAALTEAIAWVECNTERRSSSFALRALLKREDLPESLSTRLLGASLAWLRVFQADHQAQFVINGVLTRDDLAPDLRDEFLHRAVEWLGIHFCAKRADIVVLSCLRWEMGAEAQGRLVSYARQWMSLTGQAGLVQRLKERLDFMDGGSPAECPLD